MSDIEMVRHRACGAVSRVPMARVAQGHDQIWGRCKASLPGTGKPLTVTDATFAAEVEQSPVPVAVDPAIARRLAQVTA